jgi:hypothetical protein
MRILKVCDALSSWTSDLQEILRIAGKCGYLMMDHHRRHTTTKLRTFFQSGPNRGEVEIPRENGASVGMGPPRRSPPPRGGDSARKLRFRWPNVHKAGKA